MLVNHRWKPRWLFLQTHCLQQVVKITSHHLLSGKYGSQKNIAVTNFHTLLQRLAESAVGSTIAE